ncbi:MAG: cytochrome c-type biosis protein CcmH [Blastocatellia bacterium]|jgi:cytochrome c-type biogenesis protein CcmH|nr:cytochrome c-type biosis protein CcmH [Blastocatellia bacterium]
MILFLLICAVLLAIALAFILPPLWQSATTALATDELGRKAANVAVYQDQISELTSDLNNSIISAEQYKEDREALERRLLEDVSPAEDPVKSSTMIPARPLLYGVALGLPVLAIALYFAIGNPRALSAASMPPSPGEMAAAPTGPAGPMMNGQPTQQQIEANVAALAKRLEQNPGDVQGWIMLARSYTSMEKFTDASAAFAKATALKTDDAGLWADYAFALAMTNDRKLEGQPVELVNKALKLDPENPKALQLAGSAAFEAKNYKQAIEYWQRLLQKTSPDTEMGQALTERIAEARTLSGSAK